jgi:hypothetical protein
MTEITVTIDDQTYTVNTETDLTIDANNLSGDMVKIAGQFATYGALSATLYAKKKEADQACEAEIAKAKEAYEVAKDQLQELESSTYLQVRTRLDNEKQKYTERVLASLIDDDVVVQSKRREVAKLKNTDNNELVKRAQAKAIQLEEQYRKVKTLADAFSLKASMLQSLGAMTRSEMSLAGGVVTKEQSMATKLSEVIESIDKKTN